MKVAPPVRFALQVASGMNRGKQWMIGEQPLLIGRSRTADICINDPIVSRRQCELMHTGSAISFRELQSRNPTLINGHPRMEARLHEGDQIIIGTHVFIVSHAVELGRSVPELSEAPTPVTLAVDRSQFLAEAPSSYNAWESTSQDHFQALFAFARSLSTYREVPALLEYLHRFIQERLSPSECWLATFLPDTDHLIYRIGMSCPANLVEAMRAAALDRAGLLLPESQGLTGTSQHATAMVAPLVLFDKSYGALVLRSTGQDAVFNEVQLELLVALAHTLSPYLHYLERNAQLERDYAHSHEYIDRHCGLIGASTAIASVRNRLEQAAGTRLNVLILGETGTGKELAARMVHDLSPRANGPFVAINCAAIPRDLFEGEMFGHERGAYTGASTKRIGRFEEAHGGTLFLDEMGELSPESQAALLRVIETGTFTRLGGGDVTVDVRIVAATNRITEEGQLSPKIRQDLLHRLNGFEILMPPLRERRGDIPLLVRHFIEQAREDAHTPVIEISSEALQLLADWHWPGNIRELRACIERAVAIADSTLLMPSDLLLRNSPAATAFSQVVAAPTSDTRLGTVERQHIIQILRAHNGSIRATAKELGITRSTLYSKLDTHGIDPKAV